MVLREQSFADVLVSLKEGMIAYREGWEGMYIKLQIPDQNSKMSRQYIYITSVEYTIPWVASQSDLLEEDWCIADPKDK